MKNSFFLSVIASALLLSCTEGNEKFEIVPIQDNATPRLMSRALFTDAPDSLFTALGLQDGIPSSVCAILARSKDRQILFDAANGAPDSQLLPSLESLGISPDAIDYIFITHLHGDHIGGLMKNGAAVFTNAEVYINEVEYEAWSQKQNAALQAISDAYGKRVKTFKVSDRLPCGVEAIEAYGHTPGHTVYKMGSSLVAGDIMHGVALQLNNPQYNARFDMDPDQAVHTRRHILKIAEDSGMKVYGMHFPEPYFIKK